MKNIAFFSNRLKEQRKFLDLTQAQVAEKCGITLRMWGNYERGLNAPTVEIIFLLQEIGFDTGYLFTGFRQPENPNTLRQDEKELLENYRQASDNGKFVILSVAQGAEKKANQDNQIQRHYGT